MTNASAVREPNALDPPGAAKGPGQPAPLAPLDQHRDHEQEADEQDDEVQQVGHPPDGEQGHGGNLPAELRGGRPARPGQFE